MRVSVIEAATAAVGARTATRVKDMFHSHLRNGTPMSNSLRCLFNNLQTAPAPFAEAFRHLPPPSAESGEELQPGALLGETEPADRGLACASRIEALALICPPTGGMILV